MTHVRSGITRSFHPYADDRLLKLVALPVVAVAITAPTMAIALDSPDSPTFSACLRPDGTIDSVELDPAGEKTRPDGKDAHEVAKANGYTGTALQWLASLKGCLALGATQTTAKGRTAATYLRLRAELT